MRRLGALTLALALLLTGCGRKRGEEKLEPGEYRFWYTTAHGSPSSAALGYEIRPAEEDRLLEALFRGPTGLELTDPFPEGTAVRSLRVEGATALVDLSEGYGSLSGTELTLADACVVLTLCQLEGVEQVYITVEGQPRPYRDKVLSPEELVLDNGF